jgi:hypothetical protein
MVDRPRSKARTSLSRTAPETVLVRLHSCSCYSHFANINALLVKGQGLSMLELSLTLATLFRRYDLHIEEGFKMEYLPSFTLRAKNGLPIRIVRRLS